MVMKTSQRLAMAAIMALGPVAAHAGTNTVAVNGAAAPGGGTYSFPHDPAIADNGQVLFVSNITATLDSGLFRSDGIAPAVVVERTGGAAPGGGTYGGTPGSYGMNPTGAGAFDIGTT